MFEENNSSCIEEILSLIPTVISKLKKAGHLTDFSILLRLIAIIDKFPLHNISFLLLLEVARWYSLDNTTKMFTLTSVCNFGKFFTDCSMEKALRFMMGVKSAGQILDKSSSRGQFDPQNTNINFAVPDIKTVNNYESQQIDIPKQISTRID